MSLVTPHFVLISEQDSVCFIPRSLADTNGISIDFFSCRYWDASLPCVPHHLWSNEKSHSGIPRSKAACTYLGHFAACHALRLRLEPSNPPNRFLIPIFVCAYAQLSIIMTTLSPETFFQSRILFFCMIVIFYEHFFCEFFYFLVKLFPKKIQMDPSRFELEAPRSFGTFL